MGRRRRGYNLYNLRCCLNALFVSSLPHAWEEEEEEAATE
jgi:hypothetical protein